MGKHGRIGHFWPFLPFLAKKRFLPFLPKSCSALTCTPLQVPLQIAFFPGGGGFNLPLMYIRGAEKDIKLRPPHPRRRCLTIEATSVGYFCLPSHFPGREITLSPWSNMTARSYAQKAGTWVGFTCLAALHDSGSRQK